MTEKILDKMKFKKNQYTNVIKLNLTGNISLKYKSRLFNYF